MKCASILPLAILLATCVSGQEATGRPDAKIALAAPPMVSNRSDCPMGLEVKHGPGLPMGMKADGPAINGKGLNSSSQRIPLFGIQLAMTNLSPQSIVSAEFVVHGFSDKSRYIPLAEASHAADLLTTVNVALDVKGNGHASHDLALSRFTAITAVDVDSITYADGSTWRASSPGACSASPDLFMPVSVER
jgi:hypothetical protein